MGARLGFVCVLGACASAPPPPTTRAPESTESAPVERKVADLAGVEAGDITLGCIGWSTKDNDAVCMTGEFNPYAKYAQLVSMRTRHVFEILGGEIDGEIAGQLTEKLHRFGYVKFMREPTELVSSKKLDLGRATIMFDTTDDANGTRHATLTATCGDTKTTLFDDKDTGRELSATARRAGRHLVIEVLERVDRVGEEETSLSVRVVNIDTCEREDTIGSGEIDMSDTWGP